METLPKKRRRVTKAKASSTHSLVTYIDEWNEKKIVLEREAYIYMALHASLSNYEVIGWLAGYLSQTKIHIKAAYMVQEATTTAPTKNVEMDSLNSFEVQQQIEQHGYQVVGWYHSHPRFHTMPSTIDIDNQQAYQLSISDTFVAGIINPSLKDVCSLDFFNINPDYTNGLGLIPCRFEYETKEDVKDWTLLSSNCIKLVQAYSGKKGRLYVGKQRRGLARLSEILNRLMPESSLIAEICQEVETSFLA